jgi:hypothetical protein
MSIRSRLDRLELRIGGEDVCRFCGNPHVRNLAQIVKAVYGSEALCDCSMCECRRPFDEAIEHYRSKKEGEETCQ